MANEYHRWLIARGNVFLPSSAAVAKLAERLREDGWVPRPGDDRSKLRLAGPREGHARTTGGYAVKTAENTFGADIVARIAATTEPQPAVFDAAWLDDATREEIRLVWPIDSDEPLPVTYPLGRRPEGALRYALEIHRAPEYVYPTSKTIKPVPSDCKCGEDLSFEWDEEEVVPPFADSTGIFAECDECSRTFDPSKGNATITNPFDGTKEDVPGGGAYRFALKVVCFEPFLEDPKLTFAPALVQLVEKEFGRSFYEFACVR
jgi:hypothetical protein